MGRTEPVGDQAARGPIAALRHNGTKTSIITAAGTASVASASTLRVIEYGSNSIFEVAARYVECSDIRSSRVPSATAEWRLTTTGDC